MTTLVDCIPIHVRWHPQDLLGAGGFGEVYEVCDEESCSYVMKIVTFSKPALFSYEVKAHEALAECGLALPLLDHWLCKRRKKGVLVMLKLDITLKDFLENENPSLDDFASLKKQVRKLVNG